MLHRVCLSQSEVLLNLLAHAFSIQCHRLNEAVKMK